MEEHSIREREASGHSLSLYSGAGFAPGRAQLFYICRVTDHSPVQRRGNLVCPEEPRHRLGGASGGVLENLSDECTSHPVNQRPRDPRVKRRLRANFLVVEIIGMYGPPLRRKRKVRMSQVGLRKCIRPLLEWITPCQDGMRFALFPIN